MEEGIKELVKNKDWRSLKNILSQKPAPDIAELLQNMDEKDMVVLYRLLPREQAAEVFAELNPQSQRHLLKQMNNQQIRETILELHPDDRTELFEELPGQVTQKLLNLLPPEERKEAMDLLGYPENSVGRLMTPDYIAIKSSWKVEDALQHIRKYGRATETIDTIYIVDDRWHLLDDMPIKKLILADPKESISSLMDNKFISISAFEDQEKAAEIMKRYDLVVLPVVDSEGILMGIITIDDILDVLEEETTEDFQKESAVAPLKISYSSASSLTLYRKRIGWLLLLLIADFLSSSVIAHFKNTLQAVIALAFFIPVLI